MTELEHARMRLRAAQDRQGRAETVEAWLADQAAADRWQAVIDRHEQGAHSEPATGPATA